MLRGEVRWFKFQNPDKKRPVVVLTRSSIIDYINNVTIAPITSTIRDIPSEVLLSKFDGMPKECVVNTDHIQTISKSKIGSLITKLNQTKQQEISTALKFALDL
jgi:mRNA interferase MazF